METKVIVTTPEELQGIVNEVVQKALKEALPKAIEEAKRKPYLNTDEVMELTGWARRTVQHLRDTRQIEFIQHSKKILYPRNALDEFFEKGRVRVRRKKLKEEYGGNW